MRSFNSICYLYPAEFYSSPSAITISIATISANFLPLRPLLSNLKKQVRNLLPNPHVLKLKLTRHTYITSNGNTSKIDFLLLLLRKKKQRKKIGDSQHPPFFHQDTHAKCSRIQQRDSNPHLLQNHRFRPPTNQQMASQQLSQPWRRRQGPQAPLQHPSY